jgi:hypothetical protein
MENPFIVLLQVVSAFEAVGIDYVVVGSLASSIHGDYRASAEIDVVAELRSDQIEPLVNALKADFYIDDFAVQRAVRYGRSFNAIHLTAIFKVDIFVATSLLDKQQLMRREKHALTPDIPQSVWVATPEDTVLAKLYWYRLGGRISELQWRDVVGILATQGSRIDFDYLRLWAEQVGVLDLFERALEESQ